MEFASFDEIGTGSEVEYLQRKRSLIREKLVTFPVSSPGCMPAKINTLEIDLPRFSLFEFENCRLQGFRVFETNSKYFTDTTLVDTDGRYKSEIIRKFQIGQVEDLKFDANLGNPEPGLTDIEFDGTDCALACSDEPSNFGS